MPLITEAYESLPYVDSEPSTTDREAAEALINAELPHHEASSHPALPNLPKLRFSPLAEAELSRVESKQALQAIDLSRYEALEPPSTSPRSDEEHPETLTKWREALAKAYISHAYLTCRQTNLAMLDKFGKNAWLIGNYQSEGILKALNVEHTDLKGAIDKCVLERRNAQDAVGAELQGLADTWRRGVARVLDTELANEQLRQDILDVSRNRST